jgi:predicted acylesterase/phospholipase RssA
MNLNKSPLISGSGNLENARGTQQRDNHFDSSQLRSRKGLRDRVSETLANLWRGNSHRPGLLYVLNNSAHFMQERITRSRLACDPPDLALVPKTWGIGFMEFHRAEEAIEIGENCVHNKIDELKCLVAG